MLMRQLAHDIAKDLAAFSGAAGAGYRLGFDRAAEVRGKFLARCNPAEAIKEQAPSSAAPRQISITTVIDKLRTAAADASVNRRSVAMVNQIVVVRGLK